MSAAWRELGRRPLSLTSLLVLAGVAGTALFADLLASDLPLFLRLDGERFVLPAVTRPVALRGEDNQSLKARLDPARGDFMISPLVPYGPRQLPSLEVLTAPGGAHPLGTDELGRDVFARLVHGARVSLGVGVGAMALSVLLGTVLGLFSGFYAGKVDFVVSRLTELMLSFPSLFLVLCVVGLLRAPSLVVLTLVLGLTRWTEVARLVRAEVLRIRELDYIHASRALGLSNARILLRHVLPNALPPVLVAATFGVASAILLESGLSFLGFGAPPPTASWGELLTQAHRYVLHVPSGGDFGAWWLTLFPGLALFLTVTAINLVGETLRDALDPRMRA